MVISYKCKRILFSVTNKLLFLTKQVLNTETTHNSFLFLTKVFRLNMKQLITYRLKYLAV